MTQDSKRVTLSNVRFSFVNILTPREPQDGGAPKYSTTVLLPKSDVAGKQRLDAAIEVAIQEGISSKWNGQRPAAPNIPVHDGDGLRPGGEPFGPECAGHWVFTASANISYPPQVVDAALQPILSAAEVYSGMFGNVAIRTFPYYAAGRKGVGLGLEAVQKTRDGEPLGGTTPDVSELFAGVQNAPQTQQAQYQPQPQGGYAAGGYVAPATTNLPYPGTQQPPQAQQAQQAQTGGPVQIDPFSGLPINNQGS